VGAGLYEDSQSAAGRLVELERTIEPEGSNAATYRQLYEQWLALYAGQLELSEAGLAPPMWRAAGA
jgi:sugar (pentulose or hexulose) kinase